MFFGNVEYVCLTPNYVDFQTMRFWTELRPLVSMLETIIPISPIFRQDLMVTHHHTKQPMNSGSHVF